MSQTTIRRIHTVYGIVLTFLIVAVGVGLAASCLSIYRSGDSPFTRESIGAHFERLAVLVYVTVAAIVGGIVLSLALPLDREKTKPVRDAGTILAHLAAKVDMAACDPAVQARIRKERTLRRVLRVVVAAVCVVAAVPPLVWCLHTAHFSIENLNNDIIAAATLILPCAVVALGGGVAVMLLCGASVKRETALVKSAMVTVKGQGGAGSCPVSAKAVKTKLTDDSHSRFVWVVRGTLLVVAVAFIVLGVLNGGMADVLGKAVRICTECIGLG